MLRNYFKIAFRNLGKNKIYAFINIFGLSLAFLCSILLFINAYDQLSFDNFHEDKERIFKTYNYAKNMEGEQLGGVMSFPVATTLKDEVPEIESATRFAWCDGIVEYNGKTVNLSCNLVDPDFFKVFTFPVSSGNKISPLNDLGNIVLTEYAAKKIFNTSEPIGKSIKLKVMGEWKSLVVSAVLKDFPENSSLTFDALARTELRNDFEENKNNWNMQNHEVFVKIATNASQLVVQNKIRSALKKLVPVDSLNLAKEGYLKDENGDYNSIRLLPITEIHFNNEIGTGNDSVSKTYLYSLLIISLFILATACFNFINLNIAQSFNRSKEVGVRKCLGASRKQIFLQVWGESLLICIIALIIGFSASLFVFPYFNQVFNTHLQLNFFYKPSTILSVLAAVITVSLFAGGYPALIISKLNTTGILKGKLSMKKPGFFRNSLIVFQFSTACLLMICTLIAFKQFDFMKNQPLGINKDAIISIPLSNGLNGRKTLEKIKDRLSNQTDIKSITGSNINIGLGKDGSTSKWSIGFEHKGEGILTNWLSVDYDFVKTFGIKILKGRDFDINYGTDSSASVLVTEGMAKQFKVTDVVGTAFSTDSTQPNWNIIGVIPDFHLYSLHEKIEPITLNISSSSDIRYVFVKVNAKNAVSAMDKISNVYKEIAPNKEFRGSFLDDNIDRWYQNEKRLSLLLGISSVVAIALSCLGLFALALLMIKQRIKEIGVRKVLGASVFSINQLLAKDFLKLVIIAIIIASPIAWWLMTKWLQDFPYKTTIGILVFIAVGLTAIIISLLTISFNTIKAAMANPVESLRTE